MELKIDNRRVDLWCTAMGEIGDDELWARYGTLLSEAERAREARYRFAKDRRRHRLARVLVRTVLSRYAKVRPEDWVFTRSAHGRPEIAAPRPAPPLSFNLSHSADLVILGVGSARPIGVDVEHAGAREIESGGLDRYFAPEERKALLALPLHARRQRFFELWTLKESYLKARGVGLRIGLDAFRFQFEGGQRMSLHLNPELHDSPRRWGFWQFALRTDYIGALCAGRRAGVGADGDPVAVVVREVVPLVSEAVMELEATRTTD